MTDMPMTDTQSQIAAGLEDCFVRQGFTEPGVARFDVIQQQDDPCRFVLVEVYRTEADAAKHKETTHYQTWRDTVADMMAEPRQGIKYHNVFPEDGGW